MGRFLNLTDLIEPNLMIRMLFEEEQEADAKRESQINFPCNEKLFAFDLRKSTREGRGEAEGRENN